METIRYIYNGANQVACIDADANGACNGTEFWVYDAHGNLTFDRTTRYVYDAANHLATVCDSGDGLACDALGNETTYQYNGDGARVAQSVRKGILPATLTTYTLDTTLPLTQVLSETTSGQTTRYLHGLDLIAQSDGTSTEYLAYDGLGSVRQLVDGSGAVLTSQTFDPYGTPYSAYGPAESSFGFTGEETDENGLVYLRARYYNPAQGRFMQVDPSRMERNGYQYAGSSPGMFTDPSGHCMDRNDPNFDGIPTWPPFLGGKPCVGSGLTTCHSAGMYDPVCNSISARDRGNVLSFDPLEANPLIQNINRSLEMWKAVGEGRWGNAGQLFGENCLSSFSMVPGVGMVVDSIRGGPASAAMSYQLVADYDTALSNYRTGRGGSWDVVWSTAKPAGLLSGTVLLGRATQGVLAKSPSQAIVLYDPEFAEWQLNRALAKAGPLPWALQGATPYEQYLNMRAQLIVKEAHLAAGTDNFSRYVDEVFFDPLEEDPGFTVRGWGQGERIINIDYETLTMSQDRQLLRGSHELVHAQDWDILVSRPGDIYELRDLSFREYFMPSPEKWHMNYYWELRAESLGLYRTMRYYPSRAVLLDSWEYGVDQFRDFWEDVRK